MMFKMPAIAQGRLVGLEGSVKGRVFLLSTGTFVIGRVETTDLPLSDAGVSREHAKIGFDGDAYAVSDLESRNGTFVNGKPVRTARLQEGDVLRICAVALRFTFLEVQSEIPPEFSLEDDTDEVANAPRQQQARVPTVSMMAPREPPNPAKRIVLFAALATVVALGSTVAVIVVMTSKPATKIATTKASTGAVKTTPVDVPVKSTKIDDKLPAENPTDDEKAKADAEKAKAEAEIAKADAEKAKADAEKAKADAEKAKADVEKANAVGEGKKTRPDRPKRTDASKSEWLAARAGPEPVFAPVDGIVTSIGAGPAVAGQELVVVNEVSVKAPATGALRGAVRFGDRVRKGQLLARISEGRLRADVPSSLAGRAKRGAKVELQEADGSTTTATIVDVVAGTMFIDSSADISWVRFR